VRAAEGRAPAERLPPACCGPAEVKPERKARWTHEAELRGVGHNRRCRNSAVPPARCGTAEARPEREARWASGRGQKIRVGNEARPAQARAPAAPLKGLCPAEWFSDLAKSRDSCVNDGNREDGHFLSTPSDRLRRLEGEIREADR
jgi:hypothetical protein